jgi:hypothetical protein
MTSRKSQDNSRARSKRPRLAPRRRGQGDVAPTVAKSYTLPFPVVLEIRRAVKDYGSQGRALQVASELTIRMKKRPTVQPVDPEMLMRMTYKLTPRTIQLIDELARKHYGNSGQAIAACIQTLKMKKI